MIIASELQMQGEKHVMVNIGMLQVLRKSYPDELIELECDDLHLNCLSEKLNFDGKIQPKKIFTYSGKEVQMKYWLFKTFREVFKTFTLFRYARKNNVNFILFFSVAPFTAPFINLMAAAFEQQIITCIHGDIGVLTYRKSKFTTSVYRKVVKLFFKLRNTNYVTVLFFSEVIKQNFYKLFPQYSSKNVIAIDHPYDYKTNNISIIDKNLIVIANIGTALMLKNSDLLFELALKCKTLVEENKIQFLQIGSVSEEVKQYANTYVKLSNETDSFITMQEFESSLQGATYFVYFFTHGGYYDLCASGTFFDAIKNCKPIIALSNPFFDYYFQKLGNIGYLCNSLDEMKSVIEKIATTSNDIIYKEQIINLMRAKETLNLENIAFEFLNQYSIAESKSKHDTIGS